MNSKKVALLIVFSALTIFLNLSPIKIPAPYAPFLIYQVWEIPIVAFSILFGITLGSLVTILNTLILIVIYPGVLPTGPFYNMIAVLSMLVGIHLSMYIIGKIGKVVRVTYQMIFFTVAGVLLRVVVMSVVNFVSLPQPPPIGFGLPMEVVLGFLPLIALFNASIVFYTVPIGMTVADMIKKRLPF